jgi:hypothetical protein
MQSCVLSKPYCCTTLRTLQYVTAVHIPFQRPARVPRYLYCGVIIIIFIAIIININIRDHAILCRIDAQEEWVYRSCSLLMLALDCVGRSGSFHRSEPLCPLHRKLGEPERPSAQIRGTEKFRVRNCIHTPHGPICGIEWENNRRIRNLSMEINGLHYGTARALA